MKSPIANRSRMQSMNHQSSVHHTNMKSGNNGPNNHHNSHHSPLVVLEGEIRHLEHSA